MIYLTDKLGCKYRIDVKPKSHRIDSSIRFIGSDYKDCDVVLRPSKEDIKRIRQELKGGHYQGINLKLMRLAYKSIEPVSAGYLTHSNEIVNLDHHPILITRSDARKEKEVIRIGHVHHRVAELKSGDLIRIGMLELRLEINENKN